MEAKIFEAGLSVRSGIIFGLGGLWEEKKKMLQEGKPEQLYTSAIPNTLSVFRDKRNDRRENKSIMFTLKEYTFHACISGTSEISA